MAVARKRSRLVPLRAMPMGRPTPLANAAIDIPPVITMDVIKPVSMITVIVFNRFIFWQFIHEPQFHQEKMTRLQTVCSIDMPVVFVLP